jgi:YVTN family beta-propeller protein
MVALGGEHHPEGDHRKEQRRSAAQQENFLPPRHGKYPNNRVRDRHRQGTVVGKAISVGHSPTDVTVSPDGRHAYVTDTGSDSVSVIDTTTGTVTGGPIAVGESPRMWP